MTTTFAASMALAQRRLADARWRVLHETMVWGEPSREAVRRREALLLEVRHLEMVWGVA